MDTKIVNFVADYQDKGVSRFHMPGHKGHVFLGCEPYDITEIKGADVLHLGDGVIKESEREASKLFGSGATHFSTEGSSHCIKAMLAMLRMEHQGNTGERMFLLAARNVHRSMIDACALLDLDVEFLWGKQAGGLCSCTVTAEEVKRTLAFLAREKRELPLAVYLTSPDYLGEVSDIAGIAKVCEEIGIPLVVDQAHGAYLHFFDRTHALDLGASICCDSAHKTLPVLTGGAYLHIHEKVLERFEPYAKQAMCMFGSTSPSYLVLQSLDLCNRYLAEGYEDRLHACVKRVEQVKLYLKEKGICLKESEPLKIVIKTAENGYSGEEIAEELRKWKIECEYADREQVVLMVTPENKEEDYGRLEKWAGKSVLSIEKKERIAGHPCFRWETEQVVRIRKAAFTRSEEVPVIEAVGRVCAAETVSCPPAVPIAICGERITARMIPAFLECGITKVSVAIGL